MQAVFDSAVMPRERVFFARRRGRDYMMRSEKRDGYRYGGSSSNGKKPKKRRRAGFFYIFFTLILSILFWPIGMILMWRRRLRWKLTTKLLTSIVTLALCVPDREIHFMGKKELFENKALGWIFRQVHGFPVDRGNMDMGAIRTAMGVLKEGETLGIFPEGTRSRTGHMLPLLGGASLLALKSGCDVVPIYIEGSYKPFHRMIVHVGRPVEMADLRAGRMNRETCDELTRRMEAEFAQLSGGKSLPPAEA